MRKADTGQRNCAYKYYTPPFTASILLWEVTLTCDDPCPELERNVRFCPNSKFRQLHEKTTSRTFLIPELAAQIALQTCCD